MTGARGDAGLIPRICDMLFHLINRQTKDDVSCEVTAAYLEIYNEKCRDLLRPAEKGTGESQLKVRDNPKSGPFVQGLSWLECRVAADIEALMEEGLENRTVGSTNMNSQSSRSHSIFTIYLSQKRQVFDGPTVRERDRHSKVRSFVHSFIRSFILLWLMVASLIHDRSSFTGHNILRWP